MNNEVVLSFGSNVDESYVAAALSWIGHVLEDMRCSSIYKTPAVHGGPRDYSNAVVSGYSRYGFDTLNAMFKDYEYSQGRDAAARDRGIVAIDIDIVVWNDEVVRAWDYRQTFFKTGFSELAGAVVERQSDCQIDKVGYPHR